MVSQMSRVFSKRTKPFGVAPKTAQCRGALAPQEGRRRWMRHEFQTETEIKLSADCNRDGRISLGRKRGCQMAIGRFLESYVFGPSGFWTMAPLRYATLQNWIPSFPWIAPPRPPPWRNPRKGRDPILPSGNHGRKEAKVRRREQTHMTLALRGEEGPEHPWEVVWVIDTL